MKLKPFMTFSTCFSIKNRKSILEEEKNNSFSFHYVSVSFSCNVCMCISSIVLRLLQTLTYLRDENCLETEKIDLNQRVVSRVSEPFNSPFGQSAGSLPLDTELTHPVNSLKSKLQVILIYVHRQPWEKEKVVSDPLLWKKLSLYCLSDSYRYPSKTKTWMTEIQSSILTIVIITLNIKFTNTMSLFWSKFYQMFWYVSCQ